MYTLAPMNNKTHISTKTLVTMQTLNYNRLAASNPTVLETFTNNIGQTFELVEHPTLGDEYPVIIVYKAENVAVCSEFYDCDDLTSNIAGDYHPVYMFGDILLGYEVETEYPLS